VSEPAGNPAAQDDSALFPAGDLASDELDVVLARRTPRRKRVLQATLTLVVVIAAAGTVAHSARSAAPAQPAAPPAPTYVPYKVAILSNVTYGTLILNGRKLAFTPAMTVTLPPGDNVLALLAPPFLQRPCHVLVNLAPQDSRSLCDVSSESVPRFGDRSVVYLPFTADDLPPDLRADALAAVATALADTTVSSSSVPAGQYFATGVDAQGTIHSRRATERLTATLTLAPEDTASDAASALAPWAIIGRGCADLTCTGGIDPEQPVPAGHVWTIAEPVLLTWRFVTASGALAGAETFRVPEPLRLTLAYDLRTGWHLSDLMLFGQGPNGPPLDICGGGAAALQQSLGPNGYGEGWKNAGERAVAGCELDVQDQNGVIAHFIWRFGVLLAANAPAHTLLPALPIAPPDEIAAVTG
jgi:hypothetical protein